MPGFDGTGPRGEGPLTGRGEGYCVLQLPDPASGKPAFGFAGLAGVPVWFHPHIGRLLPMCLPLPGFYPRRWIARGNGLCRGRGYGRRFFLQDWW
ncbi:MAG: DUF5320 domain-containing protein [Anaerolineae bacterium]